MPQLLCQFGGLIVQQHVADDPPLLMCSQLHSITKSVPWSNCFYFRNVRRWDLNFAHLAQRCSRPVQHAAFYHNLLHSKCTPNGYPQSDDVPHHNEGEERQNVQRIT